MMWAEFLRAVEGSSHVSLIGPLVVDAVLKGETPTVYVDGGARARKPSPAPTVAVGDGDSGQTHLDHQLPTAKDYSDLAFILRNLPTSVKRLTLQGFWGGRADHQMINFGEVHQFIKSRGPGCLVEWLDGSIVHARGGVGELKVTHHGRFSLVVLEETNCQLTGDCDFRLESPTKLKPLSSHGLSNHATGTITVRADLPFFIFLNEGE